MLLDVIQNETQITGNIFNFNSFKGVNIANIFEGVGGVIVSLTMEK